MDFIVMNAVKWRCLRGRFEFKTLFTRNHHFGFKFVYESYKVGNHCHVGYIKDAEMRQKFPRPIAFESHNKRVVVETKTCC